MKKFYLLLAVLLGLSNSLFASDSTKVASPFSASLELTTKYMWRGIEYGTAPTVFPMIGYGREWQSSGGGFGRVLFQQRFYRRRV